MTVYSPLIFDMTISGGLYVKNRFPTVDTTASGNESGDVLLTTGREYA